MSDLFDEMAEDAEKSLNLPDDGQLGSVSKILIRNLKSVCTPANYICADDSAQLAFARQLYRVDYLSCVRNS